MGLLLMLSLVLAGIWHNHWAQYVFRNTFKHSKLSSTKELIRSHFDSVVHKLRLLTIVYSLATMPWKRYSQHELRKTLPLSLNRDSEKRVYKMDFVSAKIHTCADDRHRCRAKSNKTHDREAPQVRWLIGDSKCPLSAHKK